MADSKFQRIEDERQVRDGFWPKMAAFAANLPFAEQALAAWYCAFDSQTPSSVRYTLVGALAYFVLPFDIVPDILPMIGFADDASILSAAVIAVGTNINETHKAAAREALARLGRQA
jgi:uncharacterized membrane protein YkvA (DUF1232 family)